MIIIIIMIIGLFVESSKEEVEEKETYKAQARVSE